jgi:hypothetical protein
MGHYGAQPQKPCRKFRSARRDMTEDKVYQLMALPAILSVANTDFEPPESMHIQMM